jgi:hypothetical protein
VSHLRDAGEGVHVLTLRVHPEDLGPIRITAHLGADGSRIELAGLTPASREALRASLGDLRRELADTGIQARLDLGADTADASGAGSGQTPEPGPEPAERGRGDPPARRRQALHPPAAPPRTGSGALDLIA